jgi:hypothetical protein
MVVGTVVLAGRERERERKEKGGHPPAYHEREKRERGTSS